jgi:hypothetical protein
MKNTLRVTIVLLVLAATGSPALPTPSAFEGPGPVPCPDILCPA